MSLWINHSMNDRLAMVQQAALAKRLPDMNAVEKDWWVTLALRAVFSLPCSQYLIFKGGTSLSKGWGLIDRFSEDIDLCIGQQYFADVKGLACAACENNNQIKFLRKASHDFVIDELSKQLQQRLLEWGIVDCRVVPVTEKPDGSPVDHDSDPTTLLLEYESILQVKNKYLPPAVKIEVSCLGMREPFEVKRIGSIVGDCFPDEDDENVANIATVLPSRTFLEKAFLLNEEFQRKSPRFQRMSRHLYDLEKLMDTTFAQDALTNNDLYDAVIAHRARFYHVGGVNYDLDRKDEIDFVPKNELGESFRSDYEQMQHSFIYGESLDFDEMMSRLELLRERFRNSRN